MTRRKKIEGKEGNDVDGTFRSLVKARTRHEIMFYKLMKNIEDFKDVWNYDDVLCIVIDIFSHCIE